MTSQMQMAADEESTGLARELWSQKPDWAGGTVGPDDMAFLVEIVRLARPATVLEIGVASGLSSVLFLKAARLLDLDIRLYGMDTQERYYLDRNYRTGQLVWDLCPDDTDRFNLLVAPSAAQALTGLGPIDLAFIDGNHLHPWPTFDLLSVLPTMRKGGWAAFHDINLNMVPRHKHRNRGSKYVFEHWYGEKRHSAVRLPMIGAVRFDKSPVTYLDGLIDLLHTPHEDQVPQSAVAALAQRLAAAYGVDESLVMQAFPGK